MSDVSVAIRWDDTVDLGLISRFYPLQGISLLVYTANECFQRGFAFFCKVT
jgi:hypothetical protein